MDRSLNININCVVASAVWCVVIVAVVIDQITPTLDLDSVTIVLAVTAAVLNIRGFIARLEDRERKAFELGREYEAEKTLSRIR